MTYPKSETPENTDRNCAIEALSLLTLQLATSYLSQVNTTGQSYLVAAQLATLEATPTKPLLSPLLPISRVLIVRVRPHVAVEASEIQNPRCWQVWLAPVEVKQGL